MQCIICGESADFYFSKSYAKTPFKELLPEEVNYYKCSNCGFVLSKTHADFTKERWGELNEAFHHWIEQPENNLEGNQPPYAEQALMLSLLGKNDIIKTDNMLDYATG